MTPEEVARKLTAAQEYSQLATDLTANWDLFSDADPLPCERDEFLSRMLDHDFVELVDVDEDALEDPFAYERGIEPGGMMWRLTTLGLAVRKILENQK